MRPPPGAIGLDVIMPSDRAPTSAGRVQFSFYCVLHIFITESRFKQQFLNTNCTVKMMYAVILALRSNLEREEE
eukprot:scaffold1585_cov52-Attheya_sp.AAC.1